MHEMSLVQNIIDIVVQEMERHGVEQLRAINLAVGRMSAVVPEQMTLCYEILTSNTPLAGTVLNIRLVPITYQCLDCEKEFPSEGIASQCPFCRSENLEMIFGRELKIESIEVMD
jgi:hydrogenase nickel incorporation protein HypA/HybF